MGLEKVGIHIRSLESRKKGVLENWKIPEQDKKDIFLFLNDLALGKVNKGKKISEARLIKYLDYFRTPFEYWNKPIAKLTLKDIEAFEKYLTNKKDYSISTKAGMRIALKVYFKWKGLPSNFYDWFDCRTPNKTPDYLSEPEIEKLYKACKNNAERYLIAVLFDSGARAEEFHNIRIGDIQLPSNNENYIKLTLKEEYSKTKGRVISLYWKHSLEAIRDYLNERKENKTTEPIFENTYDNARQILYRLGLKALNKSIHYHLFRHSSATYYATKLNRQELCYRYGWAFSSKMPDTYISRAGMESKQLDEKFKSTELEEIQKKFEKDKLAKDIELEQMKKKQEDSENKEKEYSEMFSSLKKEIESLKKTKKN
jgi:integrase